MPSAHLAAGMGVVSGRLAEAAAAVVKKALPIAGEGLARTLTLLPGLLLTSVNADADPAKDADWQLYHRNHAHPAIPPPLSPDKVRLAQLEHLYEQGALTPEQEAELIALLAKVKGIHVNKLSDLPGKKVNGKAPVPIFTPLLPGEGNVGTYKELLDAGSRGDNLTPHHIPSDAYIKRHGIAKNDGVCINMEQPKNGGRHRRTKTCGRNMTDAERETYYKLSPKEALQHDIEDARQIFREEGKLDAKMEQQIQEAIKKNKNNFPNLYGH